MSGDTPIPWLMNTIYIIHVMYQLSFMGACVCTTFVGIGRVFVGGREGAVVCFSRQALLTLYNYAINNHWPGSHWEQTGKPGGEILSNHWTIAIPFKVSTARRQEITCVDSSSECNLSTRPCSPPALSQPLSGHLPEEVEEDWRKTSSCVDIKGKAQGNRKSLICEPKVLFPVLSHLSLGHQGTTPA